MKRDLAIGIGSSLIASGIFAVLARAAASTLNLIGLWQEYRVGIIALVAGLVWFGGYWLWLRWKRQRQRLDELERQASDRHIEHVVYAVLNQNAVTQRINAAEQRLSRLEEWKVQGGGDTLEAVAERAIRSGIDPARGGMNVQPPTPASGPPPEATKQ